MKFAVPIGLGVVAAVVNWMILKSRTEAIVLTRVTMPLDVGDRMDVAMLEPVEVPASFESLKETAVPFTDRGALIQQRANRKYLKGDLVLWRDIGAKGPVLDLRSGEDAMLISLDGVTPDAGLLKIGNFVSLRIPVSLESGNSRSAENEPTWVGPFRLVSIGAIVTNDDLNERSGGDATSISVAIKQTRNAAEEQNAKLLELFCDRQRLSDAKLLGVKLHRAED